MSEHTASGSYKAWDNKDYPWPPPEGWYQAPDGLWWPEGYGPGPAGVETAPTQVLPTVTEAAADPTQTLPTVAGTPPAAANSGLAAEPLGSISQPPTAPEPAPETYTPPVSVAPPVAAPPPGMPVAEVAPAVSTPPGYGAAAPGAPGSQEPAKGGKSGLKVLLIMLGIGFVVLLVAVPVVLFAVGVPTDTDAGTTTTAAQPQAETTLVKRPAPPEGVGPGSLSEPWAIDDSVAIFYPDLDGDGQEIRWTVKVAGPAVDGTAQVLAENEFNDPPPAGQVFVLVPIEVTYKSGPDAVSSSVLQFEAIGPSGQLLTESDNYCGVVPNDFDNTGQVTPGEVLQGNVCWSVPAEDLPDLKLIVEVSAAQGAVYIDVTR